MGAPTIATVSSTDLNKQLKPVAPPRQVRLVASSIVLSSIVSGLGPT